MTEEASEPRESRIRAWGRRALAVFVLLIAAWLLFHLLFHLVVFVATILAVVVAIVAGIWAVRVLF
jgi:uncharacterized RDD family membrane protein YckC